MATRPLGRPGFDPWHGQEIFLFCWRFAPALGPRKPRVQLAPRLLPRYNNRCVK